jgi:hypothetical protein
VRQASIAFRLTFESARFETLQTPAREIWRAFRSVLRTTGKSASMQTGVKKFSSFFKGPSCYLLLLNDERAWLLELCAWQDWTIGMNVRVAPVFFLIFTGRPFRSDFARLRIRPLN